MKRKLNQSEACTSKTTDVKNPIYIGDKKLSGRIYQILQENSFSELSVSALVDLLQQNYTEYRRKKRIAFATSVEKAYSVVLDQLSDFSDSENNSDLSSISEGEIPGFEESSSHAENINSMNSLMTQMYKKNKPTDDEQSNGDVIQMPRSPSQKAKFSEFCIDREGDRNTHNVEDIENDKQNSVADSKNADCGKHLFKKADKIRTKKRMSENKTADSVTEADEVKVIKKKKSPRLPEKTNKLDFPIQFSEVKFSDVGGNSKTIKEVCKLLMHLKHPVVYQVLGVTPPCGFLLHGPPGCGKTLFADSIAGEMELPYLKLSATEIVSGVSGESEEKLRGVFDQALEHSPCILFLDEIDSIAPNRENASKDMERRIVSQLLTCMDELTKNNQSQVLVIGATNRPDSIDPALRRAGRFDREIALGIPDEHTRMKILQVLCRKLRLHEKFEFPLLARLTPGYVGADLSSLVREAAMFAINRIFMHHKLNESPKKDIAVSSSEQNECIVIDDIADDEENCNIINEENNEINDLQNLTNETVHTNSDKPILIEKKLKEEFSLEKNPLVSCTNYLLKRSIAEENEMQEAMKWLRRDKPFTIDQLNELSVTMQDFEKAIKVVQPSAQREGFATVPNVTWEDIGALKPVREELQMAILAPVKYPDQFEALGLKTPPGILLTGPPGCGKTLLAKAVANESGINFISVKGPELLNMYVGESEKAVRQVFQRARNSSPCVIFFDEIDALCPRRSGHGESGSSARVVNQLLTEMDGLEERKQVFVMGATNRLDIIDPAVLRPGRLDKTLYVGLPSEEDREDILITITKGGKKPNLASDVDLHSISRRNELKGFSGADLAALVREASVCALRELMTVKGMSKPNNEVQVYMEHFEKALTKVKPSVSEKDQNIYKLVEGKVS